MLFSQVLDTVRRHGDAWAAEAPASWGQGRTIFGGLQAALAVRAMRDLVPQTVPLRVLQTSFVAPVSPGSICIEAKVLRRGKSVTQVEARLLDQGQTACLVVGVFGQRRPSAIEIGLMPPLAPDPETAEPFSYIEGVTPVFTRQVIMRWVNGMTFHKGAKDPKTQIFVGFRNEPYAGPGGWGEAQIIAYGDMTPTPGLSLVQGAVAASSLTWTLELLTDDCGPARDGLWRMDSVVDAGRDGYLNETAILSSPEGTPVALSRQSVAVFG